MKNSKFLRSKNLLKSLEAEELKSLNDKRQKRKDNGNIDSVSERYRSHGMTDGTEICPTKTLGHDGRGGFTLVELVITIAIVIILSVISVPIYRGYVDKAKYSEGYALLGTILSAQKAYYSEYGNFLRHSNNNGTQWTSYNSILGIDSRGNKYFTEFMLYGEWGENDPAIYFDAHTREPEDLRFTDGKSRLVIRYNVTSGVTIDEY